MNEIQPTQSTTSVTSQNQVQAAVSELGSDVFLRLLVTQLQSQDPTNPIQNEDFIAQLAQFTSLEQATNTNELLTKLIGQNTQRSQFDLVNLLGHEVVTDGNTISLGSDDQPVLAYALSGNARSVQIEVMGPDEKVLRVIQPDTAQLTGGHQIVWDGLDSSDKRLPEGVYSFQVKALDSDGKTVPVLTFSRESVTNIVPGTEKPVVVQSGRTYTTEDIISIH